LALGLSLYLRASRDHDQRRSGRSEAEQILTVSGIQGRA
jgi:hypothetical protein